MVSHTKLSGLLGQCHDRCRLHLLPALENLTKTVLTQADEQSLTGSWTGLSCLPQKEGWCQEVFFSQWLATFLLEHSCYFYLEISIRHLRGRHYYFLLLQKAVRFPRRQVWLGFAFFQFQNHHRMVEYSIFYYCRSASNLQAQEIPWKLV
jgi:hypothetical protein